MRNKFGTIIFVVIAITLVASVTVAADDWAIPNPFYILSEDKSRIFFVNFPRDDIPDWLDWSGFDYFSEKTGLYYNTNPPQLIYSVINPCWNLQAQDFIFSRDIQYFAWIPTMNLRGGEVKDALALVIYGNGVVLREYIVGDLVENFWGVSQSTTMVWWLRRESIEFNPETNELMLTTVDNLTYLFTLGEVGVSNEFYTMWWIIIGVVIAVIGIIAIVLVEKMRKKKQRK